MTAPDAGALPAPGSDAALPPFVADAICPKCEYDDIAIRYHSGWSFGEPWPICRIEHIDRTCRRCHYEWQEACLDQDADPLDNPTLRPRTAPAQQKAGTALNDPGSVGVTPPVQGDYTKPAPARCGCGHLVSDHRGGVCQHALCLCADMRPRTDAETGERE